MRTIQSSLLTQAVAELFIECSYVIGDDVRAAIDEAKASEPSPIGRNTLEQISENYRIAGAERIAICQDTGLSVIFTEVGQDAHIEGLPFEEAIQQGVREAYLQGYLRKSIVSDPLFDRINTKDNTPAVIHYQIVSGDQVKITVAPKGFGSENMSRICMLKPADGAEGVKNAVIKTVLEAGPNSCPPVVVGVGIGGDFEKCAILAKKALTRPADETSGVAYVAEMEKEILNRVNKSGIGPAGLGGTVTALAVNIEVYPTHIAGLPVAINMCCHVDRHITRTL